PARRPAPKPVAKAAPPPRIVDLHNYGHGRFALDFAGDVDVGAAASLVFPGGVPAGVSLSEYGPRQILLEHVTQESLAAMPGWLAHAFVQSLQGNEDDPRQHAAAQRPVVHGMPHPEIEIDTPEKFKEWLEGALDRTHQLGDVAELAATFAKIGENIAYS